MVLKYLEIENFRNFVHLKSDFDSGINIISGKNGQGKTSILESIYYLALTKSFRTANDNHVISHEKKHFNIISLFSPLNFPDKQIRLYFASHEGKHLFVNKKEVQKLSEYIGTVPCVILTLDDLRLTMGGPQERRRFLDILISQVSPVYLEDLKAYRRTLQQRNALLSSEERAKSEQQLPAWNKQLIEYGTNIILHRIDFIEFLDKYIREYYANISGCDDHIHVDYNSSITENIRDLDRNGIIKKYETKLAIVRRYEFKKKVTVTGPHRDDIYFYNDKKIFKEFCSQGENKTLVIALKFLEWEYISQERQVKPILLLDDIFGELDESRMNRLLDFLQVIGQTFITTTMQDKFKDHIASKKYVLQNQELYHA
jgi:DNA replication and repair protein RecF